MTDVVQVPGVFYQGISNLYLNAELTNRIVDDSYLFSAFMVLANPFIAGAPASVLQTRRALTSGLNKMMARNKEDLTKRGSELLRSREDAHKVLAELKQHLGDKITAFYSGVFCDYLDLFADSSRSTRLDIVCDVCGLIKDFKSGGAAADNLKYLKNLLGFSQEEVNLISMSYIASVDPAFSVFWRYLELSTNNRPDVLASIVKTCLSECVTQAASNALMPFKSKPIAYSIVRFDTYSFRFVALSSGWINALSAQTIDNFKDFFIQPVEEKKSYRGAVANVAEDAKTLVGNLIEKARGIEGCNVLFYGSNKLNVRGAAIKTIPDSVIAYELTSLSGAINSNDMASFAIVAQALLASMNTGVKPVVLFIDKAECAITQAYRSFAYIFREEAPKEKDELSSDEHLLTKGKVTTIWATTNVNYLDDQAIGRFLAQVEVKAGTREDRRAAIAALGLELKLSPEAIAKISLYAQIGDEQLRSAAKLIEIIKPEDTEATLIKAIEASQKALGRDQKEDIRTSVTKYDLGLLNVTSKYPVDKVIDSLKKKGTGTMCFFGIPGSGKTQLAEHIAMKLDKPLLVKRASDILGMYVGENEKNIRAAFEEAKSENAVFLLDEADSFLRDRSLARQQWEVTMVNELLVNMERFPGVFICATNLFSSIDTAAIRRFTFKFEFKALNEEQRQKMFFNETGVMVSENEHKDIWFNLMSMTYLTPGDFATVKRQINLMDQTLSPEEWINQLKIEIDAKMDGLLKHGYNDTRMPHPTFTRQA